MDWAVSISRVTLLLAPKIDRGEPSWWNYIEQGTVTRVLSIGELFVTVFGLCSVLIPGTLSYPNGCLGISYSPQVKSVSSRMLASALPFCGNILKPLLLS